VARHRERRSCSRTKSDAFTTASAPRLTCSRVTTTDGRSPGSRVNACAPPSQAVTGPVAFDAKLAAYSCGGSRGIGRKIPPAPRSLLIPEGNRHGNARGKEACSSTKAISDPTSPAGRSTILRVRHLCRAERPQLRPIHMGTLRAAAADVRGWPAAPASMPARDRRAKGTSRTQINMTPIQQLVAIEAAVAGVQSGS